MSKDVVWIERKFRDAKLPISVFPGAYNRGHGDLLGDKPFMHHTGSANASAASIAQHPTLGLASQLHLAPDGHFTLCGVGVAYHAGVGSGFGLPKNNGNWWSAGIEAAHNGTAAWPKAQLDNYLRGIQVMNEHRGAAWNDVVAHKEYGAIQGKWDPGNLDMKWVRQQLLSRTVDKPVVINMIELEAKENPWVGVRQAKPGAAGETPVGRDGKGRMVRYDNAHIYFHPSIGAFAIPHADPTKPGTGLFEAYAGYDWERGPLGYPVRDFTKLKDGAVQAFQGGVLYRKDGQPGYYVHGVIGQRWAKDGYEKGDLGYPRSLEIPNGTGGVYQLFEHGALEWDPSSAVKTLGDKFGEDGEKSVRNLQILGADGLPMATDGVDLVAA